MSSHLYAFPGAYPLQLVLPGEALLQRCVVADAALFVEEGRVALGIAGTRAGGNGNGNGNGNGHGKGNGHAQPMEHQLGMVTGPAWLEANAAILRLPSAVDALAETVVKVRRVPVEAFCAELAGASEAVLAVLTDLARTHRQQTESALSRLSKDAEARCAEWLLRHAEPSDKGVSSVKLQLRKRLLAAQLGIAPETLSRVLRHLRERSLISGSGRILNLVDPGGLRSVAGV